MEESYIESDPFIPSCRRIRKLERKGVIEITINKDMGRTGLARDYKSPKRYIIRANRNYVATDDHSYVCRMLGDAIILDADDDWVETKIIVTISRQNEMMEEEDHESHEDLHPRSLHFVSSHNSRTTKPREVLEIKEGE